MYRRNTMSQPGEIERVKRRRDRRRKVKVLAAQNNKDDKTR